jgi:hypothetical protein
MPDIFFSANFPTLTAKRISRNEGVSLVSSPEILTSWHENEHFDWENNIVYRNFDEDYCTRQCGYAVLKNRYTTKTVSSFIDYLK